LRLSLVNTRYTDLRIVAHQSHIVFEALAFNVTKKEEALMDIFLLKFSGKKAVACASAQCERRFSLR
jgi:hypothetical protein